MFGKTKTEKTAREPIEESVQKVDPPKEKQRAEIIPINSILHNMYCQYNYDYDNSYVKWLVEDEATICGPVVNDTAHTPRDHCQLPDLEELMREVSVPQDLISATGPIANTEEDEEEITIL